MRRAIWTHPILPRSENIIPGIWHADTAQRDSEVGRPIMVGIHIEDRPFCTRDSSHLVHAYSERMEVDFVDAALEILDEIVAGLSFKQESVRPPAADEIVIAGPALQRVVAVPAIQIIVAPEARQDVVVVIPLYGLGELVTGQVECTGPKRGQCLDGDFGREWVAGQSVDLIKAVVRTFANFVGSVV